MEKLNIVILGAGAWGSAIGNLLADNKHNVTLYAIDNNIINDINNNHKNSKYLNDIVLNENLKATNSIDKLLVNVDILIIAIPSKTIKEVLLTLVDKLPDKVILVNLSKGFDIESSKTLSEMILAILPDCLKNNLVTLVGPSFAIEVALKQITAVSASSYDINKAKFIQQIFSNDYFRVYTNDDVIGTEYCSALKNVVALACGMLEGLGFKDNTRAALITRAMNEIKNFVVFFGGKEKTCLGLSGYGDLILTCTSKTSRNYMAGYEIGKYGYDSFIKNNHKTVEGIIACNIAYNIAKSNNIYAPIIISIHHILFENKNPMDEILKLIRSELKPE